MTISEISARTNVSIHTLRYYEKEGLLKGIQRNNAGHRTFSKRDLEWVIWIKRLKSTGMSLIQMREFSNYRENGHQGLKPRRKMLEQHTKHIHQQISAHEAALEIVNYKIDAYKKAALEASFEIHELRRN